jgi:hypothetical protein
MTKRKVFNISLLSAAFFFSSSPYFPFLSIAKVEMLFYSSENENILWGFCDITPWCY